MRRTFLAVLSLSISWRSLSASEDWEVGSSSLFKDLSLVEEIDREIKDKLPFFYNNSFIGGYVNMPSARMAEGGMIAAGAGRVPPYNIIGLNFQPFDHLELSGNYVVYTGITEPNFGTDGFGDDAERAGNVKFALLLPQDGFPILPSVAVGINDFIGTKRFNSQYIVLTKEWVDRNFEFTLGWAKGRIKGPFGGLAWTPFRHSSSIWVSSLSVLAEYDATRYKKHSSEHPSGRKVSFPVNIGLSYVIKDLFQFSVSSIRGRAIGGTGSIRYPLGTTTGWFPKIDDPSAYQSPIDTEPLGVTRPEKGFAQQLAFAMQKQGLDLYTVLLSYNKRGKKELWIKVINNRYREEPEVKERLEHLLSALVPSDVETVVVVIEADALATHSYRFRTEDLLGFRDQRIAEIELDTLAPMKEAIAKPDPLDSRLLFERRKRIWTFTIRPRLLTFFGSAQGKLKYSVGFIAVPEGYIYDQIYYRFQFGFTISSSMNNLSDTDRLNPSQLVNVRTDTIRYYQSRTASFEQGYLQKSWNLGKGWFYRLAAGYFEPAYGGGATEALYYPVNSDWAFGAEAAVVMKRRYQGFAFTHKIRKLKGNEVAFVPFLGVQYFFDLYYTFRPLDLEFKISAGQFLAKDKGARFEVSRYYRSGLKLSLWYTLTNGRDKVNGKIYHDKGFAFSIPLDIFLKKSSRSFAGYAMSAWLRDVGAQSETGKPLYTTLNLERR